ncbi:MAG: hypothetical protein IJP89_01730 [Synergistaceae bacterium]|nr:hypothetical protein [Synergistaceae bacterium]MBR0257591.1 hypothetical protein [Synergistaceae bacterium]
MRFEGTITGGFCWEELTRKRWEDSKCLERYGFKVYSQNDEDGIIQEIFRRIGTTDKHFIEFGVQNCNQGRATQSQKRIHNTRRHQ